MSPTLVSWFLGPQFAWVYTCLPLVFRTCLPLWAPWAAWFYTCLPLVPHTWVPWAAWVYTCLPLVSHTCLPHLSPTLGVLGRMSLHMSSICLPYVSHSECLGPNEFKLVSHTCLQHLSCTLVSPTCLPLSVLWVPWVAWVYTCLPLVFHTCLPLWVPWAAWFYTSLPLVPHTWVPFAAWVYTCLPLVSHTCLAHSSPTLVSQSGFLGLHEFCTCLPLVFHTCLSLWVPWAAWFYTCLPHLSLTLGCLGPHEFTLVSHTCLPHLSPTLVLHTCLPHLLPL